MGEPSLAERLSRYAVAVPFAYRGPGRESARPLGWTRDLSERGAWVELPEAFGVATDLEVRFQTRGEPPWLPAQVVWVRPEPTRQSLHLHGLTFARMTPAQGRTLRAILTEERPRRASRWYCSLAVTCQRRDGDGGVLRGRTRDLSEGGVAVRLPAPVAPGTPLRVSVETGFGVITADAEVVWTVASAPPTPGALFRHGLRFVRLGVASDLPLSLLLAGLR